MKVKKRNDDIPIFDQFIFPSFVDFPYADVFFDKQRKTHHEMHREGFYSLSAPNKVRSNNAG